MTTKEDIMRAVEELRWQRIELDSKDRWSDDDYALRDRQNALMADLYNQLDAINAEESNGRKRSAARGGDVSALQANPVLGDAERRGQDKS